MLQVPGPELPAPTAQIWLDMAKLVSAGLPNVAFTCEGLFVLCAEQPMLCCGLFQQQPALLQPSMPCLRVRWCGMCPPNGVPSQAAKPVDANYLMQAS
jgi:hypothetical protein